MLGCNPVVLVTAAHCLQGVKKPSELRVACGARNMSLSSPSHLDTTEVRLEVTEIVEHPKYRDPAIQFYGDGIKLHRFLHDIAIIKVKTDIPCKR